MTPDRIEVVKGTTVEEYTWNGKKVVYVNNVLQSVSYEEAVMRLKRYNDE